MAAQMKDGLHRNDNNVGEWHDRIWLFCQPKNERTTTEQQNQGFDDSM